MNKSNNDNEHKYFHVIISYRGSHHQTFESEYRRCTSVDIDGSVALILYHRFGDSPDRPEREDIYSLHNLIKIVEI